MRKIWIWISIIYEIKTIPLNLIVKRKSPKMVSRTSVKEQLIELATTESLSTSIKNFVKEKFGEFSTHKE